jgi:hypothetical protein
MNDFRTRYATPSDLGVRPSAQLSAGFLTQAFGWMFAGLLLTAGVAALVNANERLLVGVAGLWLPIVIGQLALVLVISAAIQRLSATAALGLFFIYAASVGLTVGVIVAAFSAPSVATAFLSASTMFGAAALYGAVTKRSLASMRGYLTMGLVGLIVAMVLNIFLNSGPLGFIISIAGVIIFTVLTAYDVQRIASGDLAAGLGSMEKAAVIGALSLYLDFINLFLFMLRLFGGNRD